MEKEIGGGRGVVEGLAGAGGRLGGGGGGGCEERDWRRGRGCCGERDWRGEGAGLAAS